MITKAFALLALVLAPLAGAQPAYRLLQADYQGRQIGSKHYSADGYVTLPRGSAKPYKAVMVLPVNSTSPEALADYTQQKSSLSCVLLVLPSSWDSSGMPAAEASNLLRLEQQLLAAPAQVPVFFAKETAALADAVAETHAMFERGAPPTQQTDRYQLALQGKMPAQLASKQATNYVATLRAADDHLKLGVPPPPTLLLTAHFDSFSLAPGSPAGADAAASGAVACLLLLRLLHRLYASPETRPSRNVMVLLTTGGPYGQQGLLHWAADADPAQLEAIEAAIVLDSIGSSVAVQQQGAADSSRRQQPQLHMHHAADSSSSSSSSSNAAWADAVAAAAARMGVQLTAVQEQLAGSENTAAAAAAVASAGLGHEHLARKGVPAVSLSYMPAAPAGQQPRVSSLADTAAAVNLDRVLDAAQVAADAISRWLYPQLEPQLRLLDLSSEPQQHRDFLAGWIELLSTAPSMMPFDKAEPGTPLLHENIFQFMRTHSHSAKRHMWTPAGTPAGITAFGATTATMRVLKAAGFMQDMLLLAAVLLYLGGLWVVLVVATRGWAELRAMWAPKPAARRRNTKGGNSSSLLSKRS